MESGTMIIKSMSRKAPTFTQLLGYFHRDGHDDTGIYTRNLYALPDDGNWRPVAKAFEKNATLLPARKNGNALYHEVLVLEEQQQWSRKQQVAALHDLAEQYLARRAPTQLAYGKCHFDTEYPHIHLMISSNGVRSDRRVRLSRAELATIQREVEAYAFEKYPDLNGDRIYTRAQREGVRVSSDGYQAAKREGKSLTRTEEACAAVSRALSTAHSAQDLSAHLKAEGLSLYRRGKTWGVCDTESGRRYRLKTLGLLGAYEAVEERFSLRAERETECAERRKRLTDVATREAEGWDREDER